MKQLRLYLHYRILSCGVRARAACIMGSLFLGLTGFGADQPPPKDFSAGFAKFYDLGLPVVTNAVYVKLDLLHRYDYTDTDFALYEIRLAGNAWMLKQDQAEDKGLFVMNNCRIVEVYNNIAFQKKRAARLKEELATKKGSPVSAMRLAYLGINEPQGPLTGNWKSADPKKDIEKTIAFLKKKAAEGSSRYDSLSQSSGYGTLLLSAIHFHHMGFTNEANEIVGLLFEAAQDQRKVLTQALVKLADAQYSEAADEFFQTGDWQAYDKDLESMLGKFAMAWEKAPAVGRLAERVKARINQPEPPAIADKDLSDEDKRLALELATATNWNWNPMLGTMGSQLWILPAPTQHPMLQSQSNAVTRILNRGIKSIPLLLALVKDDYLTSLDIRSLKGTIHVSYSFSDNAGMTEERINSLYNALHRPASRSDIAIHFLDAILIKDEERQSGQTSLNRDELYEQVQTWYAAHNNQSAVELARFFLKEGNERQQNEAVFYLLKSGDESDAAAIEGLLLKEENPMSHLHLAQQYVMERGDKAKNFFTQYEKMFTQFMESDSNEGMFRQDESKLMVEQSLAAMKDSISGKPPDAVLEEILAGTKSWEEAGMGLHQAFAKKKPDEILSLLLGGAVKATNANLRIQFVQMAMSSVSYRQYAPAETDKDKTGAEDMQAPDIRKTADLWKQLLSDTRAPDQFSPWERANTVADSAARSIETIYGQQGLAVWESRDLFQSLGSRLNPLIKARAEARLAGKPENELPDLPSAAAVSKEQKKTMVDELMKDGAAELEAKLAALNLDSLLALAEEADDDQALNKKLGTLANRVNTISVKMDQEITPSNEWEAMKGKTLDKAMVEQLMAACRKATEDGMISRFCAARQSYMGGMEIQVNIMSATNKDAVAQLFGRGMPYAEMKKAVLSGMFSSEDQHAYANWPVEQKKQPSAEKKNAPSVTNADDDLPEEDIAEQVDVAMQEDNAEQQAEFWKAVQEFCDGNGKACSAASIQFNGMPILPEDFKPKPGRRGYYRTGTRSR